MRTSLRTLLERTGLAGDAGANVPESRETLAAQQRALVEGRQRAQMFPLGTDELPLPRGMERVETPRGVFHFDPAQLTVEEVERASHAQRENEILGLGPASKADVMARGAAGEPIAAVVEEDPVGREVKAAITTPGTQPAARAELEQRKAPDSNVTLRPVDEVVNGRGDGALSRLLAVTGADKVRSLSVSETAKQSGKLLLRGAGAEGLYAGIEGAARGSANLLTDAATGIPGTDLAGIDVNLDRLRARRRELLGEPSQFSTSANADAPPASPVDDSVIQEIDRDIAALERRKKDAAGQLAKPVKEYAGAVRETRESIRRALPVDPDFAVSLPGQIAQGIGQAVGTLPVFVVPGAGPGATLGLLYQQGYDDAVGHGADEETAHRAGVANVPAAALEYAADKLVIGKVLKPLRGKVTVGQLTKDVLAAGAIEGGTEGAQQGWQNYVAKELARYDPDRPLDDQVLNSMLVGAVVGGTVTGTGQLGAGVVRRADSPGETRATPPDAQESPPAGESRGVEVETASAGEAALNDRASPIVVEEGIRKKPALGEPAEAIAAAIQRRPDTDFKPLLPEKLKAADVDVISHLGRYGETTRQAEEDFASFAERMTEKFGERVQAYLPRAWESVNEGQPVKDLVNLDNPVKIEPALQRATKWGRLFWEGSSDMLRRSGVRSLADAIDTHVDFAERNLGKAWSFVRPAMEKYQGVAGLVNRGRAKQVFQEFADFYRAKENGRLDEAGQLLAQAHPETRRLIDGVQRMFEYTGQENRRLGVRVQARGGGWRPIGYLGREAFPRMLREDVLAVLRDPSSNPKLWQEMQRQLVEGGNIARREQAGEFLAEQQPAEAASDFMGGMEKARTGRLPEAWYEYRFNKVVPRFVAQWAERAAQIEAFGQKTGPESKDAFDHARGMTNNGEAVRYINSAQDHAYRVNRMHPGARRALGNVTSATTALFLGNPYSTLRNLVGGTAQTVNQFGVLRSIGELRQAWKGVPDAETTGALKADVADMLFNDDGAPAMRQATNAALKVSGFNAAENFVRSLNYLTAKSYLRDALRAQRENPTSRRSLQDVAFLRRMGFEPDTLTAENMKGPETDRFLRGAVREAQGGYRYNQVPLFVDSPLGRFLFQFARWGTQATRFHAEHVIKPAIVGDLVPVRGADGISRPQRVRTLLPLLRSPLVAAAAGATTYALRGALFGVDRPDPTWDEVFRTMDEDQKRGVELALGRMLNDVIMGGTFGALSDYSAMLKDAAERGRYKNPIEPPAASILKETGLLAYKLAQQGKLSAQDYREYAERLVTGWRYGKVLAYSFANATGAEWDAARTYQAEQDRRFARIVGRRFADEIGADVQGYTGGLPNVNENSPAYDDMEVALLAGDAGAVARVRAHFVDGAASEELKRKQLGLLHSSALGRQPIKPGGRSSIETRAVFMGWARRRLSPGELRRMVEIQRRYFETGRRGGLFTERDVAHYVPQR